MGSTSLTRGKAAKSLAKVLADPKTRHTSIAALQRKFASETLEARCADLLLVVLLTRAETGLTIIEPELLRREIKYPSILSQLVFEELGVQEDRTRWKSFHSGSAPADFFIDNKFEHNVQICLPRLYWSMAESIQKAHHIHFFKRWAFESANLLKRTAIRPEPPSYFPGQTRDDHYYSLEYPQSDLYKSAFLRALSWAYWSGINEGELRWRALLLAPIDVGLARVDVTSRPDWWPALLAIPDECETAFSLVWKVVRHLWENSCRDEWAIAEASGPVWHSENRLCEVTILSGLQSLQSLELPRTKEAFEWLEARNPNQPGNFGL